MPAPVPPIYFDYNATTPLDPLVRAAMLPFLDETWGNPSSVHQIGRRARALLDDARDRCAAVLGSIQPQPLAHQPEPSGHTRPERGRPGPAGAGGGQLPGAAGAKRQNFLTRLSRRKGWRDPSLIHAYESNHRVPP